MLTTPTLDKLQALNLMGMARAFQEQLERPDYQQLSFEERFGLLVDREAQDRENRRLERHLKTSRPRPRRTAQSRCSRMGHRPSRHLDHRADRRRQNVSGLCAGAGGDPSWPHRPLPASAANAA